MANPFHDLTEDPEGSSLFLSAQHIIYKSLQGLQGHHGHTHNQTKTRLKTLSRKVFRGLQGLQENIDKEYEILQNIFSA